MVPTDKYKPLKVRTWEDAPMMTIRSFKTQRPFRGKNARQRAMDWANEQVTCEHDGLKYRVVGRQIDSDSWREGEDEFACATINWHIVTPEEVEKTWP